MAWNYSNIKSKQVINADGKKVDELTPGSVGYAVSYAFNWVILLTVIGPITILAFIFQIISWIFFNKSSNASKNNTPSLGGSRRR